MATRDLIVVDDELMSAADVLKSRATLLEDRLTELCDCLSGLAESPDFQGEAKVALAAFVLALKSSTGKIRNSADGVAEGCSQFLTDIDAKDDFLY